MRREEPPVPTVEGPNTAECQLMHGAMQKEYRWLLHTMIVYIKLPKCPTSVRVTSLDTVLQRNDTAYIHILAFVSEMPVWYRNVNQHLNIK
jgi:hypothetical protein